MSADYTQRVQNLQAAASRKRQDAEARARRAIMAMKARGALIDFSTVAEEAGVSTSFLYRHPALRADIAGLRKQPPPRIEPRTAAARSKEASNAVKLAVASEALRQLRAENEVLRSENSRLQGELQALRRASSQTARR